MIVIMEESGTYIHVSEQTLCSVIMEESEAYVHVNEQVLCSVIMEESGAYIHISEQVICSVINGKRLEYVHVSEQVLCSVIITAGYNLAISYICFFIDLYFCKGSAICHGDRVIDFVGRL